LKKQLENNKLRLDEELREKNIMLNNAKNKRESIGVELYGYQQSLAKLQLQLEQTHQNHQVINKIRLQAEDALQKLRRNISEEDAATKMDRVAVEKQQLELDRLAATLKQVEAYNENMKGEIAVTRRAAYAVEGAVTALEKEKMEQDFRVDTLQENLKGLQQALQLHTTQHEAQVRETRAALETLAEAEAEMESVHFEKKQLVAQWRSSLVAVQKRDEALAEIQNAIREQQQQELNIQAEIAGYKRDIVKQQIQNEQVMAVLRKVEGEAGHVAKNIEGAVEKQERLQEVLLKLTRSLAHTEEQIKRVQAEAKAVNTEQAAIGRAHTKAVQEIRQLEDSMVMTLGDQTTAEKSTLKTTADIRQLKKTIRDEEMGVVNSQNELAKLQVDILNTEAHNTRLAETLKLLDDELREKSMAIEKYELEIKRRNDEIERKTRDIDILNRRLEKLVANLQAGDETGPLEATIKNLQREIDNKNAESEAMQRRWIAGQTELVGLQNENGGLTQTLGRMRSEHTVLVQKRRRLELSLESHQKEIKALGQAAGRLHVELQRVNGLIAQNAGARETLAEANTHLEMQISGDLRDMETEAARMQSQIDDSRGTKRDTLAEIVEVERQIMLWERKLMLEKEMHDAMDPNVGQDVVGEMKREIHRMQLRHAELMRLQEKLVTDLEKALTKRELVAVKGRATAARVKAATSTRGGAALRSSGGAAAQNGGMSLTRGQLDKAVLELERSIKDTEKELGATDVRLAGLEAQRFKLQADATDADGRCQGLRDQEETLKKDLASALAAKYKLLLATSRQQKTAKRYEDMQAGRYRPLVEDPANLDNELAAAGGKLDAVLGLLDALRGAAPQLGPDLDRVLCHVAEV